MVDVGFLIAFTSGVISFFAPCVLPLIPAYVGYVAGVSLNDLKKYGEAEYRSTLLWSSVLYILGFSLIFVLLGSAAAGAGVVLRQYSNLIQRVGGALIIVFGLNFAGIINLPFLAMERKLELPGWSVKLGHGRAFLLGLIFGISWTPCVGAVLGSILVLAAQSQMVWRGASLLFVYSLGISVPFLIISMSLAQAPNYLKILTKHIGKISMVAGLLLAVIGILLLTDTYKYVNSWLFEVAYSLGYQIK